MACDASTLLRNAAANGFLGLDSRSALICIATVLSDQLGGITASQALSNGITLQGLSDEQLDEALSASLCAQLG